MRVVSPVAGPAAELAPLSHPSGPWLHLLDAAPADARQLGWLLGQQGIVVRQLRGHCARTAYGLLDEVGAALQLPGDPVEDWPALAALLTDLAWLPGAGHVLVLSRSSLLLAAAPAAELRGLVDTVREVARCRTEEGDPVPFHLVLQDDTVGLAALRARLDAVGARYTELAGWDAQEPSAGAAVPVRSVLTGGPVDPVDLAAGAAASTVDGVVSVGRAWEELRGGSSGRVRVYVPVLAGAADLAAVAGAVAAAVAAVGESCVVLPVPADPALADARQAVLAAAATEVWPAPATRLATSSAVAASAAPPTSAPPAGPLPSAAPRTAASPTGPEGARAGRPAGDSPRPEPTGSATVDPAPPTPDDGAANAGGSQDRSGTPFELVAANLQWPFDAGSPALDAVDSALVAHATGSAHTAALFRAWVREPDGSWVRVILGYVHRSAIADVQAERSALIGALQGTGAGRCCVEMLAAADVSDAHRWLEQRCHSLWPPPLADAPTPAADGSATPAGVLPADATFRPGPAADDPAHAPLLAALTAWAEGRPGVVAVVTAWTGGDRLVVGVALDGDSDPDRIRAEAPSPVEPFVPSRGLDPAHLRLTRSCTRIWTRRADRGRAQPAVPAAGVLRRPAAPAVADLGPPPVRDTADPRGDSILDGFTVVGIDRDTAVTRGAPQPDDQDTALVEWARGREGAIALLRGVTEEQLRVYCVVIEETVDPEGTRRGLASAAAAAGLTRAAIEAFAPAGAISAFHLDLAVNSTRLWPR